MSKKGHSLWSKTKYSRIDIIAIYWEDWQTMSKDRNDCRTERKKEEATIKHTDKVLWEILQMEGTGNACEIGYVSENC